MSNGSQQQHLIIFIYPSTLFLALFKLLVLQMQNLIFSRCLIFQPLFIQDAEISVTGICLAVGFAFSASKQLPDGAGVALGIWHPHPPTPPALHWWYTEEIRGAKYLACANRHYSAQGGWCFLSLHSRMHISGRTVRSQSSGWSFLLHPLVAHRVCRAALRGGDFSAESVFCLLPRFHCCSYRLVHPCEENNT